MVTTRKFSDVFLMALWVYSYASLVRVFMLLRRVERWGEQRKKNLAGERREGALLK